ncbi:hypothetical protein WK16_18220 [Burkholderia ubonensis]|nr:hypothetical protein WK16_18220 [Burkholderia ubonensis]
MRKCGSSARARCASSCCSDTTVSAPADCNAASTAALRPVAITFAAPRCFAIRTASRPDAPVAPLTSTVSPAARRARSVSAAHDDNPGIAIAAAVTSSSASGSGTHCASGTTVRSAIAPNGASGPKK